MALLLLYRQQDHILLPQYYRSTGPASEGTTITVRACVHTYVAACLGTHPRVLGPATGVRRRWILCADGVSDAAQAPHHG